ncbi:hypothetical protein KP509_26G063600 [Ceratopteris richardii]|uniref:Aladin seven-bladed propeller domain-containing protein n=2 Tax=Ceratopteris richardii TaxID=49495 RepID=A0A8T2RMS6_CERRI|nr:hypothetical protein KP509_26G063600 [Ceratopteris richardii]
MPVVPSIGESTVCELHRDFLTCTSDTDTAAEEAYTKILGRRYPRVPFAPYRHMIRSHGVPDLAATDDEAHEDARSVENSHFTLKQISILKPILSRFNTIHNLDVIKKVELFQGVSWHKERQCVAFTSGSHQVCVYDFEESEPREPVILSSECQKVVSAIAWRPNAGMTLCVACRGGVCIWMLSYLGSIAPLRSGNTSLLGAPSGSSGARWVLVDYLRNPNNHVVTSLSWNPSGRLLACASFYERAFMVWDLAQGISTPLKRGFGGICLLQWSPRGDYLFSSHMDGVFRLWETENWTSEKWSSASGPVISAMWNSNDGILLMAFDQGTTLGALYLASRPPSLDFQLLPVELPDIQRITGGNGRIEKMVWDHNGERFAVTFSGGDDVHSGLVAVYDTRKTPILALSLLGFIRGPEPGAKAMSLAFYESLDSGLLLSVCWSNCVCCTYPLIFKSSSKQSFYINLP